MKASDFKRQILEEGNNSSIRKQIQSKLEHRDTKGEILEIGKALENLVKQTGWSYIEAYMFRMMNLTGLLMGQTDERQQGVAAGYVQLMQYVDQMIKAKNAILMEHSEDDDGS